MSALVHGLDALPGWAVLVLGVALGGLARAGWSRICGHAATVAHRTRNGFIDFGRFVGRALLFCFAVALAVLFVFGLAQALPGK